MPARSITISARVIDALSAAASSQPTRGTVERVTDGRTAVIALPTGKVTIEIESGSLHAGDRVIVTRNEDAVLVTRLPAAVPQPSPGAAAVNLNSDMLDQLTRQLVRQVLAHLPDAAARQELTEVFERFVLAREQGAGKPDLADLLARVVEHAGTLKRSQIASLQPLLQQMQTLLHTISPQPGASSTESLARTGRNLVAMLHMLRSSAPAADPSLPSGSSIVLAPTSVSTAQVQPGYHLLKSPEAAAAWLQHNNLLAQPLPQHFDRHFPTGEVLVRVEGGAPGTVRTSLLDSGAIEAEIRHLQGTGLQSKTMQSMPVESLVEVLRQWGVVETDALQQLDRGLMIFEQQNPATKELSGDSLKISWSQFAAILGESRHLAESLPAAALFASAAELPELLERLETVTQAVRNASTGLQLPTPPDSQSFTLQTALLNDAARRDVLPRLFEALGLDQEHSILKTVEHAAQPRPAGLKGALLMLLATVERYVPTGGEPEEASQGNPASQAKEGRRQMPIPLLPRSGIPAEQQEQLRSMITGLRQSAEQALERLEGLQILARPARSSEGEQQVLVLPMHIDGEWTEARVQFVKKRRGKGKGIRDHYVVVMTVTPRFLGEVTVQLDFHKPKKLAVRIGCEKNGTRTWFAENRQALAEALELGGVQCGQLQVHALEQGNSNGQQNRDQLKGMSSGVRFDIMG